MLIVRRCLPKARHVLTFRHFDQDRVGIAFTGVVFTQLRSQLSGLDANYWIDSRIEPTTAVEHLDANRVLLQRSSTAIDRLFYKMAQKPAETGSAAKGGAFENSIQLFANGDSRGFDRFTTIVS